MVVANSLASFVAGLGKAKAEDDVVQTGLQDAEEVLAGLALLAVGDLVVVMELLLLQAIDALGLLLLAQLGAILRLADALLARHARGVGAALHGALLAVAAVALQEELCALATAQTAVCSGVTCHI